MRGFRFLLAGLLLALPVRGTTSYNSLAQMQTDNPDLTFENLGFGPSGASGTSFTVAAGDLDFVFTANLDNGLQRVDTPAGWPAGTMFRTNANSLTITLTFPVEVIAFGATLGYTPGGSPADITVAGNNDGAFSYTLNTGTGTNPQYLGIVGTSSFSSVTITSSFFLSRFGLTNFSYALAPEDTGEVPEPGTLALIGSGLILIPLMNRFLRADAWTGRVDRGS